MRYADAGQTWRKKARTKGGGWITTEGVRERQLQRDAQAQRWASEGWGEDRNKRCYFSART
eukprot:6648015-Pyramimonas_sp.AAC.1